MPVRPRSNTSSLVKARLKAGLALHHAGSFPAACAAYAEALDLQPENPEALRLHGIGLTARNRTSGRRRLPGPSELDLESPSSIVRPRLTP